MTTGPALRRPPHPRFALAPCAAALPLLPAAWPAASQEAKLDKVEITGSSIKRLDAETALPVQTITREEIDKSGVTTAAELLRNVSANSNGLTDGASITDGTSGQRGLNSANLRGIGTSSTLVLLNGRRLASFASPGDAAGLDLNDDRLRALARAAAPAQDRWRGRPRVRCRHPRVRRRQKTSGLDLGADWRGERTPIGRFGLTLANTFYGGYTDQNTSINLDTDSFIPPNEVKAYSLWDLTGSWQVSKALKVRAGILNLLDKDPPFSNQAYYFLASYDPTYTDPRGRNFYVSAQLSFR